MKSVCLGDPPRKVLGGVQLSFLASENSEDMSAVMWSLINVSNCFYIPRQKHLHKHGKASQVLVPFNSVKRGHTGSRDTKLGGFHTACSARSQDSVCMWVCVHMPLCVCAPTFLNTFSWSQVMQLWLLQAFSLVSTFSLHKITANDFQVKKAKTICNSALD